MPIRFISGDLFNSDLMAIAHGCNCAGVMGKGIALEFNKRYPRMFLEYRKLCREGKFNPGDVFHWTEDGMNVFNLGTQSHWKIGATLNAIYQSTTKMIELANDNDIKQIGLPRIGAGLGGLLWEDVKVVLNRVGEQDRIELIVFEEYLINRPQ